jgi:hypothetical protein
MLTYGFNNSVALVREWTVPTERPLLVGEGSAKFLQIEGVSVVSVVRATDPYGRNLGFLYRNRYILFQVAAHSYSLGWVDPNSDL